MKQPAHKGWVVKEHLAVPKSLCLRVIAACHAAWGHPGQKRTLVQLRHQYAFGQGWNLTGFVHYVVQGCHVCQACQPPTWRAKGHMDSTPVIDQPMTSVCMDIFSMPTEKWQGQMYDAILLCVDRLTGWIIALPCLKLGLTAEKAAHMMLEKWWDGFGIPSIITCDRGQQFVGQWWQTLCARLGIRCAYTQVYRPQSNGRAEVAGQHLLRLLNKLHAAKEVNWVEALPRALHIYHDRIGECGFSPYQLLFGRERPMAGLPHTPQRLCVDAVAFHERMVALDAKIAKDLNDLHQRNARAYNSTIPDRPRFQPGDRVWVLRPKHVGGHKMESWWLGPCQVVQRIGDRSYRVQVKPTVVQDVHQDHLKSVVDSVVSMPLYSLHHYQGVYQDYETTPEEYVVDKIVRHRFHKGQFQFRVHWKGYDSTEDTWESPSTFIMRYNTDFVDYCKKKNLTQHVDILQELGTHPTSA